MTTKKMSGLERELFKRLARTDFPTFVQWMVSYASNNWHHDVMYKALNRTADHEDEYVRIILEAPPRHGKTFAAGEMFPAYYLGRYPDRHVLFATHKAEIAEKAMRRVKSIIASRSYRELFPDTQVGDKNTTNEVEFTRGGSLFAVGQGAGIGGRPANLLIMDDIIARREDAESPSVRDKVWEWLTDEAMTRLQYPNAVVLMFTRWHHDDPIGRILASPDASRWKVFRFPAIMDEGEKKAPYDPREDGEVLWPGLSLSNEERMSGKHPPLEEQIRRTRARLEEARNKNPYGWESVYQQRPAAREGTLFMRQWFQNYNHPPDVVARQCDELIISVDAAFTGKQTSDRVAMLVVGRKGPLFYVLDERYRPMTFPQTKAALIQLRSMWPSAKVLIETKANGHALIADLQSTIPRLIGFDPGRMSKIARAQLGAERFEAGQVFLPLPAYAPWIDEWKEDFAGFGSRPHDDRVDAFSQAVIHCQGTSDGLTRLLKIVGSNA